MGYILQLTDNDLTTAMPKELPADFFIPDDEYDNATGDTGGSKPSHGVTTDDPTKDKETPAAPILSEDILRAINEQVSKAIAAAVQAAVKK